MRLRNVAAVTVTAEVSPFLRPGSRFNVQIASAGDARSLRGGILFTTPLAEDVGMPPVATAQGALVISESNDGRFTARGGTSGRIPDGGVVEYDMGAQFPDSVTLVLREPSVRTAVRIAAAINAAAGDGTAEVQDPGAVRLTSSGQGADNIIELLASLDTILVQTSSLARLVVDGQNGAVVAGGGLAVGSAVVTQGGITLTILGSGAAAAAAPGPGVVSAVEGASVQEIATGLHVAGATPQEIAAIFESLRDVGALSAEIVVR
jgi:flagellar P-ring protein precursor FlgI